MGSPAAEPSPMITTSSKTDNCLTPRLPSMDKPIRMTANITTVLKTVSGRKDQSSEPNKSSFREICRKEAILNDFMQEEKTGRNFLRCLFYEITLFTLI